MLIGNPEPRSNRRSPHCSRAIQMGALAENDSWSLTKGKQIRTQKMGFHEKCDSDTFDSKMVKLHD